jgi:membrane protein DedA with SNARE-associated domain
MILARDSMLDIITWLIQAVVSLGFLGLIVGMAIESTFIPLPSELLLLPAGYLWYVGKWNPFLIILFAIIGTLIGSYFSYWLGEKLGRPFVEKHKKWFFLNDAKIQKIDSFFERFGAASIILVHFLQGLQK